MKLARFTTLVCLVWLGCASEGGVTGTGISAVVVGNVSTVGGATPRSLIEVSVEGREDLATVTDARGTFEIEGDFAGETRLRFVDDETGENLGTLIVEVPVGATVVAENIEILGKDAESIVPAVIRQFGAFGEVGRVHCGPDGFGSVEINGRSRPFEFLLSPETLYHEQRGRALDCADIALGDQLEIAARQLRSRVSVAFRVVRRESAPPARDVFVVDVAGSVTRIQCAQQRIDVIVVSEADPFVSTVSLSPTTEILCLEPDNRIRQCGCGDLRLQMGVRVRGLVRRSDPSATRAERVIVLPGPVIVDAPADVRRIDCGRGLIDVVAHFDTIDVPLLVRLHDFTEIRCADRTCECRDLRSGDRVIIVGSPIIEGTRVFVDVGLVAREERVGATVSR